MNNEWSLLFAELFLNYWFHSTLFVGVVLLAFKLKWLVADSYGEIIAKIALFAGVVTSILFSADWRPMVLQQSPINVSVTENQVTTVEQGQRNNLLGSNTVNKSDVFRNLSSGKYDTQNSNLTSHVPVSSPDKRDLLGKDNTGTYIGGFHWLTIFLAFWLSIFLLSFVIKLLKIMRLHYFLKGRQQVSDQSILSLLSALTARLGVSMPIILSETSAVKSPIVFGQREIILPLCFSKEYDTDQVEAALAHELGHILRKDSLWRKVFIIIDSFFFFQPLNKLLIQKLTEIAEQRSDQFAEKSTGKSRALAEALLITAQNNFNSSQNQWVPSMKSNKSQLLIRVEALLAKNNLKSNRFSAVLGLLLTVFVLTSIPGVSINRLEAKERDNYSKNSYSSKTKTRKLSSHNNEDGVETEVDADLKGEILFNESETKIIAFPEDSHLDFSIDKPGEDKKRIYIERDGNDEIEYTYYQDGDRQDYDVNAQQWFASVLPYIFRTTGINSQERVARLKRNGGDEAVLEETLLIKSDHVQGLYMKELFSISQLDSDNFRKAMEVAKNIQSDFEMANTLKVAVATQNPNDGQWQLLFETSTNIQSDFELKNLLKQSLTHLSDSGEAQTYFFEAAESIQSDFEMKNLFAHFLNNKQVSEGFLLKMYKAAEEIQSDFELASLLQLSNEQAYNSTEIFDAYIKLSESLSSDFEMRRSYESLITQGLKGEQLIRLIKVASEHISSDFELATVLTKVIASNDLDNSLKDALYEAADSLSSSHERERVLKKLRS